MSKEIIKGGKEHLERKYTTLESFVKIVNDFRIIPDKEFGEITLFSFNGEKVRAKRISNFLCMNLYQLAKYTDVDYTRIKQAFGKQVLQEGKHYFKIGYLKNTHIYLTFLGVEKILRKMRSGYADNFLDELSEHIFNNLNPITIGELMLINKDRKLIPQYLGDPKREWVANDGDILESRGEMIIDDILFKLKIPHQPKPRIFLTPELEYKFNRKYPIIPDWNIKMSPRTIIEYWGMDTENYIKNKKWKQEMYKALGIRIINIESIEVQNIPILTKKLMELLK